MRIATQSNVTIIVHASSIALLVDVFIGTTMEKMHGLLWCGPFHGAPKHDIASSDVAAATVLPLWDKGAKILNLYALLAA